MGILFFYPKCHSTTTHTFVTIYKNEPSTRPNPHPRSSRRYDHPTPRPRPHNPIYRPPLPNPHHNSHRPSLQQRRFLRQLHHPRIRYLCPNSASPRHHRSRHRSLQHKHLGLARLQPAIPGRLHLSERRGPAYAHGHAECRLRAPSPGYNAPGKLGGSRFYESVSGQPVREYILS
jgi:hypothetical protein